MTLPPVHWKTASWEQMAQENPLFAVMSTDQNADAPTSDFSPEHLKAFFEKGETVYRHFLTPLIQGSPDRLEDSLVVEYGCGMGRVLKAVHNAGARTAGIDISPTMLGHCEDLVPEVEALYELDESGRSAMPSGSASAVFSFAVLQHISSLWRYLTAFDEMCRILKPGGHLAVQVNCVDFEGGDLSAPDRTDNFEYHSLHYRAGETEPFMRHDQTQWTGVFISQALLTRFLAERRLKIYQWRYHNETKARSVWVYARKKLTAAVQPEPDGASETIDA